MPLTAASHSMCSLPVAAHIATVRQPSRCTGSRKAPQVQPMFVKRLPASPPASSNTSTAIVGSTTINVTLTGVTPTRRSVSLGVPQSSKAAVWRAWTVSVLAGVARTNYTISDSTCDATNCRGVVQRVYVFDIGAQLQYRPIQSVTLGLTVTKEQSIYGSLGFNF